MKFQIDITTAFDALKSLEAWLNVKGEDILKFVSIQRNILYVQNFIDYFGIKDETILKGNLNLMSLHVTTNNDRNETIKKYGLMNLQDAINYDTTLGNYLREQGIRIELAEKTIEYKGKIVAIEKKDEYSLPGSKDRHKKNVIHKLFEDYQINGFFCRKNVLHYLGGVRHCPEILRSLSGMFENQDIAYNWMQSDNKCYVLKYFADLSEFTHYTFDVKVLNIKDYEENIEEYELDKRKWLIVKALLVIFNNMYDNSLPEVFSYAKFNTKIPFEHIEVFSEKEYIAKYKIKD
ncbi:MAG: hypothetical protein VB095_06245 [Anaerovorax sp.]|nr:hypothetical protein [Anaerovorax sp.]